MDKQRMELLSKEYGDAFYILDTDNFRKNFAELKKAFCDIYPNFNIAYSYKTNYTPALCRIVDELGGYAEVVSDMEMEIALRVGVKPEKIIWNGPYKNGKKVEELLLKGGTVNLDSVCELETVERLAKTYPQKKLNLGIRCNFDIFDGVVSRLGFCDEGVKDLASESRGNGETFGQTWYYSRPHRFGRRFVRKDGRLVEKTIRYANSHL